MQPFTGMSDDEAESFMAGDRYPSPKDIARAVAGRPVLDLGCGKGKEVKENYAICRYLGVDCSPALVNIARRDNPGFRFEVEELDDYLSRLPDKCAPVAIMVAVLEHVPTLGTALQIFNEARRVSEELIVGWHTPPNFRKTEIIDVSAEFPVWQNHYARGTFCADEVRPVRGGELWITRG